MSNYGKDVTIVGICVGVILVGAVIMCGWILKNDKINTEKEKIENVSESTKVCCCCNI